MNIDWKFWPLARIFKGIFTILFIVMAITGKDWFFLFPALFFGIQAVFNTGCGCYSQACEVQPQVKSDKES
jgi:uncharacterized membrane protein HdeD (DUF308 family)